MRKAVLVSLDAFFDADFRFLREDGGLTRMLREGSFCRQVKTVFPALTYPAHVTLITGCDPADSRVGQNQPFQPGVPSGSRVWNWERKHIAVPTLFDAVRAAGGRNCSVLWPVCCKNPAADWCFPEVHPLPGENVVLKTLRFGSPLFVLDSERRFGSLRQGIAEPGLSNYASAITCRAIRRKKPDLTAVHLIDLDEMRHHHGVFSPEAREAVSRNEDRLNRIRQALEETPGMEDALLIAVSDHGQSDISVTVNLTDARTPAGPWVCFRNIWRSAGFSGSIPGRTWTGCTPCPNRPLPARRRIRWSLTTVWTRTSGKRPPTASVPGIRPKTVFSRSGAGESAGDMKCPPCRCGMWRRPSPD